MGKYPLAHCPQSVPLNRSQLQPWDGSLCFESHLVTEEKQMGRCNCLKSYLKQDFQGPFYLKSLGSSFSFRLPSAWITLIFACIKSVDHLSPFMDFINTTHVTQEIRWRPLVRLAGDIADTQAPVWGAQQMCWFPNSHSIRKWKNLRTSVNLWAILAISSLLESWVILSIIENNSAPTRFWHLLLQILTERIIHP